jgi:hypothetical protein
MTISKDVINDLMPLYLAGEARPGSRRLVEAYLRDHPGELPAADALSLPDAGPSAIAEMAALDRTRKLYHRRTTALAWAIAASFSVFSFRFNSQGLQFILFRDLPAAAWVLLAVAAGLWIYFFLLHRRWVSTGLAPAAPVRAVVWLIGGALATFPYAFVISYQFGFDDVRALCVAGAFAGLAIGRSLHR